jgi:AraC family transcriptional regulator
VLLTVILSLIPIVPTWAQMQAHELNASVLPVDSPAKQHLLGDWGGMRTGLAEKGIVLDFFYISDSQGNPVGGLQQSATTWERVRGTIDIDFSRFTKWQGLQFHATALWQTGGNLGARIGALANPSDLVNANAARLCSFWLEQFFFDHKLRVGVVREGRQERFLEAPPMLSSSALRWRGIELENWSVPAVFIPHHEHPEHFLHVVLRGAVEYQVATRGRLLRFTSRPGTIFLLPRGTVDEVNWAGPTHRAALGIHPRLLTGALDESAHQNDIELREHWDLVDPHISALADLVDCSPAGTIYGEALANALAVYLVKRYAVRPITPAFCKGGLSPYRLKHVLDYIGDNLESDIRLSDLATIARMSPHYFSVLFRQSMGRSPHNYVLTQRIERAKELLRDPKCSIIQAGLDVGYQNPSHFARMFRRLVGTSPSRFRADSVPTRTSWTASVAQPLE